MYLIIKLLNFSSQFVRGFLEEIVLNWRNEEEKKFEEKKEIIRKK